MSRINGDKSRAAIAHKRGVARRAKIKQLLDARKNQPTDKAVAAAAPRRTPERS